MGNLTVDDVDAIKYYLEATHEAVNSWLPGLVWTPGWKSDAAIELNNQEVYKSGTPWGSNPVMTAYTLAALQIYAALDCMRALRNLIDTDTTVFETSVMARATMEACSQAWWLLEQGIGARRRVIRAVLIRAQSARYLEKAVGEIDPTSPASKYGQDSATVLSYAQNLGLSYTCNANETKCETEQLPSGYTARAKAFQRAVGSSGTYAIYSGSAHAELYAIMQAWQDVPGSSGLKLERKQDRDAIWTSVFLTAGFIVILSSRAIQLLGWNSRMRDLGRVATLQLDVARRMKVKNWY